MRKEFYTTNDYVHIYNRGNRKQLIVHDVKDRERFLKALFYFNSETTPINPFQSRASLNNLVWLKSWPTHKPIVKILNFILMPNHFHLILKEVKEGGIAKFMQRLGTGVTMYYNTKYKESGRLFQGVYKAKCVNDDLYLKYLSVYIQFKNTFELYPGGLKKAIREFDKAYSWAKDYQYGSLGDFVGMKNRGIINKDIFVELFSNLKEYKDFARDCMVNMDLDELLSEERLET